MFGLSVPKAIGAIQGLCDGLMAYTHFIINKLNKSGLDKHLVYFDVIKSLKGVNTWQSTNSVKTLSKTDDQICRT